MKVIADEQRAKNDRLWELQLLTVKVDGSDRGFLRHNQQACFFKKRYEVTRRRGAVDLRDEQRRVGIRRRPRV